MFAIRYSHQDTELSAVPSHRETFRDWYLKITCGSRNLDRFVGRRLRSQLGPYEEPVVRADFGGFGVGRNFSWQIQATYNWAIGIPIIDSNLLLKERQEAARKTLVFDPKSLFGRRMLSEL